MYVSINYNRTFRDQEKIEEKQKMINYGDLACIHTKITFCDSWVDSYNRYTKEFNRATDRASQEFMLDQRHSFYMSCCAILNDQKDKETHPKKAA